MVLFLVLARKIKRKEHVDDIRSKSDLQLVVQLLRSRLLVWVCDDSQSDEVQVLIEERSGSLKLLVVGVVIGWYSFFSNEADESDVDQDDGYTVVLYDF